jgi:hypothetical protein
MQPANRRTFLTSLISGVSYGLLNGPSLHAGPDGGDHTLRLDVLSTGFDKKTCWVHPRAGAIPGKVPKVVLTMQKLELTGSDVFHPLNDIRTDDLGITWSKPVEHRDTLGRRNEPEGTIVGICDFTPKWHAKTQKLLGIGHTVRYQNNKVVSNRRRETPYSIYDEKTRTWTPWVTMAMPEGGKFYNSGAGCVQRVDLANGDILLPVYFKSQEAKQYSTTVLRCKFDGKVLSYTEHGSELVVPVDRGLYEPSLTKFQGRYFLTMRNDKAGYVAVSQDGLKFGGPKKWTFDDGSDLGNYNTQQHWVAHSEALFLVYTRRGANNDHVFRHRAPLFMAQVDVEKMHIMRATEQIIVPEKGARLGNFGVVEVSEKETWVTVAEWMQTNPPNPHDYTIPMKYGADNRVYAARIQWEKPNEIWNKL